MVVWSYSPDIKWNGHQGIQDDDVTPETQKASVGSIVVFAVVQIPGLGADLLVPEGVTNGQTCGHQDQQHKDLQKKIKLKKLVNKNPMVWIAFIEASCDQIQSVDWGQDLRTVVLIIQQTSLPMNLTQQAQGRFKHALFLTFLMLNVI